MTTEPERLIAIALRRRALEVRILERIRALFEAECSRFAALEHPTLVHRDLHIANLIEDASGPLSMIDFEGSVFGDPAPDLAKPSDLVRDHPGFDARALVRADARHREIDPDFMRRAALFELFSEIGPCGVGALHWPRSELERRRRHPSQVFEAIERSIHHDQGASAPWSADA